MAKKYYWEIEENLIDEENGEPMGTAIHKISLICSNFSGKAIINIDGKEFNISEKPFSLSGSEQVFRLGEMAAKISFPKKGTPVILIDNKTIKPN